MNIRAIIFDVYGTLLQVGLAPPDADVRWRSLWQEFFKHDARLSRLEFSVACNHCVARQHEIARRSGILTPEVWWPAIVAEVVPEVAGLSEERRDEFIRRQIQTGHSTSLTEQTADLLRVLKRKCRLLGIASNAQAYTLHELGEGLSEHGLDLNVFEPDLCFWSFQHGFSKPDPHVFQIISARLAIRGISPGETLMVGDRLDNDIEPARSHGWLVWRQPATSHDFVRPWKGLLALLESASQGPSL